MFGLGAGELFIISALALIFIGPKKLPELARQFGKSLREFQKAKDSLVSEVHSTSTASTAPVADDISSGLHPEAEALPKDETAISLKTQDS